MGPMHIRYGTWTLRDPCHLKAPGAIKPYGYRIYGLRGLGSRGYRV